MTNTIQPSTTCFPDGMIPFLEERWSTSMGNGV